MRAWLAGLITATILAQSALASAPVIRLITVPAAIRARAACPAPCAAPRLAPAAGIVADGAAAVLIVAETATAPSSATLTVTNAATLVAYDPDFASYKPLSGSTMLTVSGSQIVEYESGVYILALEQAPDILLQGPDGTAPRYSQPVLTTVSLPGFTPQTLQLTLYPPPILFVHGLWGDAGSLAKIANTLGKAVPWQGLPSAFLTRFSYLNDAEFDSTTIEAATATALNAIGTTLGNDEIAVGRVDVVAHSMGGLVARHFSTISAYQGASNRTLGAFHQIVTVNTPEAGSRLANFLIDHQAATFSAKAGTIAQKVKQAACPDATTVAACFAAAGEDLAPPGQPLKSGAVFSLEPDSPNIAALPSASIPNVQWRASSSSVSQNSNLMFGTNALVFELDELIAATCPGASYCPQASSKIPTIGSILKSSQNDAIVAVASQIAGCTAPCQSTTFEKLAHTTPSDAGALGDFVLSFKNVLNSAAVDDYIACNLANTACPNGPAVQLAAASQPGDDDETPLDANGNPDLRDPTRVPHEIKPLWITPETATMGSDFNIRLQVNFARMRQIAVRQNDGRGNFVATQATLAAAPDGDTIATITPLAMGDVSFIFNASLKDGGFAVREVHLRVAPPLRKPLHFWADEVRHDLGTTSPLILHIGQAGVIDPVVVFAQAPETAIHLRRNANFRVVQNEAAPVIQMHEDGSFTALREGRANIDVYFAGETASQPVLVSQAARLLIDR